MDLNAYLDAALARGKFRSDRQLASAIGLTPGCISPYRTGRAWPDDETMFQLAKIAGADPTRALLDLNIWRAKSNGVRSLYRKLATSVPVFVLALLITSPPDANAKETDRRQAAQSVYYVRFFRLINRIAQQVIDRARATIRGSTGWITDAVSA